MEDILPPLWCVRVGAGVLLFGCFGCRGWGGWLSMLGANFNGVRVSFAYSIFISSRRSGMSPACHCLCHALSFAVTCSSRCGSCFGAHVMFLVGNYYSRWSLFVSRFTFAAHGLFRIGNYYSRRLRDEPGLSSAVHPFVWFVMNFVSVRLVCHELRIRSSGLS